MTVMRCAYCGVKVTRDDRRPQWAGGTQWYDENVLDYDNNGTWCEENDSEHEPATDAEYDPAAPCQFCAGTGNVDGALCPACPAGDAAHTDLMEMTK